MLNLFDSAIKSWKMKFRKYFFTYSDGFYKLPYLANSPSVSLKSFASMPFTQHLAEQNLLRTDNLFCVGDMYYCEVEEGFWTQVAELRYKKNVSYELIYDETLPIDYYCFSLNIVTQKYVISLGTGEEMMVSNACWVIVKPGRYVADYHFEGCETRVVMAYISEKWACENLIASTEKNGGKLLDFMQDKEQDHLILPETTGGSIKIFDAMMDYFKTTNGTQSLRRLKLRSQSMEFMLRFSEVLGSASKEDLEKKDKDNTLVARRLEMEIMKDLKGAFKGIEYYSKHLAVSETKLKADFKSVFGCSIYRYFSNMQMDLAKQMLLGDNTLLVKNIAYDLGYSNLSSFTEAFVKRHDVLPSAIHRQS